MNYIGIIEYLTKSRAIRDGDFDMALKEILDKAAEGLQVSRVNAWSIDKTFSALTCIGDFDHNRKTFSKGGILLQEKYPNYFKHIHSAEKIVTDDALTAPINTELIDDYIKPNNISSMMDIPIRIEGEMIGLVCFEHTGEKRLWNLSEQSFALSIAQLISLAFETWQKNQYRKQLESGLHEKEILLSEINHRVKNNMMIISSLLNLHKSKAKDDYHAGLFDEARERIVSMAFVHEQLYRSKNYSAIDFGQYLESLIEHLAESYGSGKLITVEKQIAHIRLDIKRAIPLSLITNELITNAYKYAYKNRDAGLLKVQFGQNGMQHFLEFSDDGPGMNLNMEKLESVGISLVGDLVEQLDGTIRFWDDKGAHVAILFPL